MYDASNQLMLVIAGEKALLSRAATPPPTAADTNPTVNLRTGAEQGDEGGADNTGASWFHDIAPSAFKIHDVISQVLTADSIGALQSDVILQARCTHNLPLLQQILTWLSSWCAKGGSLWHSLDWICLVHVDCPQSSPSCLSQGSADLLCCSGPSQVKFALKEQATMTP